MGVVTRNPNLERVMNNEITHVTVRWDDQAGVEPGWYCESFVGRELIDDSQKIWFPVQVDNYSRDEFSGLKQALQEEFPNAEIWS
jgi:hypothetical protein